MPELGIFRFEVMTVRGDVAERAVQDSAEAIAGKYGLYDSGMLYDLRPSDDDPLRFVLSETRVRNLQCDLGTNFIDITFGPRILSSSVTAVLTARIDGILVLSRLPFDNTDRDGRYIDSFSFTVGDPFFILNGAAIPEEATFPYGPQFFVSKGHRFDVDVFAPLTDFVTAYLDMVEATADLNR